MNKIICILIGIILISFCTKCSCKKTIASSQKINSTFYCGCDSPTIQKLDSVSAIMEFDSINKNYYILLGNPGIFNHFVICDTTALDFQNVVNHNRNYYYYILFSGNVSHFMYDTTMNYIDIMYNIKLTKIKNQ